jgi:hypothetical protein
MRDAVECIALTLDLPCKVLQDNAHVMRSPDSLSAKGRSIGTEMTASFLANACGELSSSARGFVGNNPQFNKLCLQDLAGAWKSDLHI